MASANYLPVDIAVYSLVARSSGAKIDSSGALCFGLSGNGAFAKVNPTGGVFFKS